MENRCDSVDALMYAYYAFMKSKEENQMLKKNKDYVEFTLQYTSVDWERRSKDCPEVCLKGYSDFSFPGVPIMDVVCNEFDHKVVVVSKRDFEKMQADVNINAEIAKQWEINYDLLLKKIGFDTVEELVNYLDSEAECDTLREAIASLEYSVKFARDERRDLSKKLEECEKDYISERDKAEAVQTENEQLKKKLQVPDPFQEYKELLEKLHSKEDIEKFEWTLNHICGGRASVNGWMVTAKLWRRNYETLSKLVGFSSVEEIQDYLTNEAEADTLREAISKLKDQVKYTCDEWYSANSRNNSWKAAAECNSPKELIEKRETLEKEIEVYSRTLNEWKEVTGCPSPSAAKTLIESGMSWYHAYNEIKASNVKLRELEEENADLYAEIRKWKDSTKCEKPEAAATWITSYESACERGNRLAKMVEKLKEEVDSWKNVTGYSTPEDYMHARISGAFHTPSDYTAAWQTATKCDTPDQVKSRIEGLENAIRLTNKNMLKELENNIDEWQKATGCETPDKARSSIADMMNGKETTIYLGDTHNVIARWQKVTGFNEPKHFLKWKADIEGILEAWKDDTGCDTPNDAKKRIEALNERIDESEACYNNLLKFTGYKSEQDIRVLLNNSEQFVYKDMRELINSLKRKAKFTESNWQGVTGFSTPEKCSSYIDRLEKKLEDIKNLTEED